MVAGGLQRVERSAGLVKLRLAGAGIEADTAGMRAAIPLSEVGSAAGLVRAAERGVFAALDLGTNNCRLLVAVPTREGFRVVDSFSRIVRLGEGVQATGELGAAAMDRAIEALHACAERLARRSIRGVRAVATEACRRAGNGPGFLERVRRETGFSFQIISAREEAELAVESCEPLLATGARRALLFDIGGGSTELAWVRLDGRGGRAEVIGYDSLPIGVVNLWERHGEAGFTEAGFAAMGAEVAARLQAFEGVHRIAQEMRHGGVQMVGTSGTVTTLAGVALKLERYRRPLVDGMVLSLTAGVAALEALCGLGREGLVEHPCVGPDRVDFVLPGCAIFAAILGMWPMEAVTVADRGLREGMLLRLMRPSEAIRARRGWPVGAAVSA